MPVFLPRRWNRQPPYNAGVDWNNPLTQNIRNLWNMSQRGMVDAVGNANGTPIGGVGLAGSTDGVASTFDSAGTTYVDLPRPAQFNLASGSRWTLLFRIATTTDTAQALWNYGDGTPNNRCVLFVGNAVTGTLTDELITWARSISNALTPIMAFQTTSRSLLVDGAWHTVMITSNGSACAIWLDGISRTVTLASGSTNNGRIDITGTAATATLGVQNTGTIGAKFNGSMSLGAFWAGDMSQFALELHQRPWQLFRPAANQTFYSLGLVSNNVTIDAGVGNAAAAGSTASVFSNTTISAGVGNATVDGLQASISVSTVIAAGTGNATADGLQASIFSATTIAAGVGNAVADGLQADVNVTQLIAANVGNAVADGLQASIVANESIFAGVGNAVAQGKPATITESTEGLLPGGFWDDQWKRIRDRERKRQDPPQAVLEAVEEQIEAVAEALEVPTQRTPDLAPMLERLQRQAAQLQLATERAMVVQRLIAEAQALQAEIEEEEDLLMVL